MNSQQPQSPTLFQPEWDFSGDEEECEVCRSGLCPEDFSEPSPQPAGVTLDLSKLD